MALRIVQIEDVDRVEPAPLQRLLQASPNAGLAEIPDPDQICGNREVVLIVQPPGTLRVGSQQAAGLRGNRVLVPRLGCQEGSQPTLGQTQTVMRGRIEIADARIPGRVEDRAGLLIRHGAIEVAYVGGTVGQGSELDLSHAWNNGTRPWRRRASRFPPPEFVRRIPQPHLAGTAGADRHRRAFPPRRTPHRRSVTSAAPGAGRR